MYDWSRKFDVSSALAANLGSRNFYSTSFTNDPLVADTLVFSTSTFVVLARSEDLLTEESSAFRSLCSVVDSLADEHFTVGECTNFFLGRESDGNTREIVERFSCRNVLFTGMFPNLGVIGNLIVQEVLEILVWKHRV